MPWLKILILAIFFCASGVYARESPGLQEKAATYDTIDAEKAKNLLAQKSEKPAVIDVRTPEEFKKGHLRGARNINFFGPRFEDDILKLPRDMPILLYCQSGRRSEAAADMLAREGFNKVMSLKGGISAWKKVSGDIVQE